MSDAVVRAPGFDFRGELVAETPGGQTLGVRLETDAETTVWFDPRLKALQQEADGKLPGRVNRLSCRRCSESDMVVLVESFSDRDPGVYLLYRADTRAWRLIGNRRRGIDPNQMAQLDFHRIKARDGLDLPVWVTTPAIKAGGPRPTVLLVHGGPWVRGGHWRWDPMPQFLASRGYLVIEPEFRGSLGYGDALQGARRGRCRTTSATRWPGPLPRAWPIPGGSALPAPAMAATPP
jgi:dipeptidyl aminopeptidase/acylaminoacyl peptidase